MKEEFSLEEGEQVIREVRIHWFFFLARLLPYAFLLLLPLVLNPVILLVPPLRANIPVVSFATPLARLALGLWWLVVWSSAFNAFTKYYLNVWVLTNKRIVEIEQRGYFRREVSSLLLDRVQDVTIEINGAIDSLLGIGDINVQTAGAQERFTMDNVPKPEELRDIILTHVAAAPAGGVV